MMYNYHEFTWKTHMKYEKITTDESILEIIEEWSKVVSDDDREKIYLLENELAGCNDSHEWYAVKDKDQSNIAIFQVISVLGKYNKTLTVYFHPQEAEKVRTLGGINEVAKLLEFIFNSLIKISTNESMKKCKIHAKDDVLLLLFSIFATNMLENELCKELKIYGKWIEVDLF